MPNQSTLIQLNRVKFDLNKLINKLAQIDEENKKGNDDYTLLLNHYIRETEFESGVIFTREQYELLDEYDLVIETLEDNSTTFFLNNAHLVIFSTKQTTEEIVYATNPDNPLEHYIVTHHDDPFIESSFYALPPELLQAIQSCKVD